MIRPILVLFPGSLGDLLCVLPAIESIAKGTSGKLVLAARGEALALASALPFVAASLSLEGRIFSQLFSSTNAPSVEAQQFFSSFAEIISWYGYSHSAVVKNLCSLSSGNLCAFPFFSGQKDCHAVGYYLQCLGKTVLRCPSLSIPQDIASWGERYWREQRWDSTRPVLTIHPGSGGKKKRWDPEGFRQITLWWTKCRNGRVLILLGPAEAEELEQWQLVGTVACGFSLWQIAALLSRTTFYVGNDSGVSHLAGAVGGRGVVVFGPTRPEQWRPLGGSLQILYNTGYRTARPFHDGISLDEVSVEQVLQCLKMQSIGE